MPGSGAGWGVGPAVSEAVGARRGPAETAVADRPDEPPEVSLTLEFLRRHGLVGGPKRDVPLSEPIANSSMLSLPSMTEPWSHRFCVTVLS